MDDTSALRDEHRQLAKKGRKLLARIDEIDKVLARQDARPASNNEGVRAEQQGDVSVETSSHSKFARSRERAAVRQVPRRSAEALPLSVLQLHLSSSRRSHLMKHLLLRSSKATRLLV